MKKMIIAAALGVTLVASSVSAEVQASSKKDIGIAVAAGIAAIGLAAAGAAAAHREKDNYQWHHGHGPDTNAVAACVHRADKVVRRAGGYAVRLDRVRKVEARRNGTRVVADMTGIYPSYRKQSRVRCLVDRHRVIQFNYN
jgi:opacity protein-like surface antigen